MRPALRAHWVSGRERAQTRAALIEVARLMVERDGEPALTLGAVADEAGLARATVYGFFAGRHELLDALDPSQPAPEHEIPDELEAEGDAAIWTNYQPDLNEFLPEAVALEDEDAAETEPQATAVEPSPSAAEPVAEAVPEPPAEAAPAPVAEAVPEPVAETAPQPIAETAAESAADVASQPVVEAAPEPAPVAEVPQPEQTEITPEEELTAQDERRRLQATHLEEIAKRLILPESALREGTDAVIARLDTRIKVLEKSISGLETKQTAAQAEGERKLRGITDQVDHLKTRADGTDIKALQTASELRLSIHKLETRIEALEAPARGPQAFETVAWPEPEAPAQPEAAVTEPASEAAAHEAAADDAATGETAETPKQHAYLSQVRTLAREGARQAEERESLHEAERQSRRRNMIVAGGIAAACLVALGVLYAFNPGAHGVSVAQSKPTPAVAAHRAQLGPLDRLSALAEKGDARAQLLVGLKYLQRDDALAARWLALSAAKGNAVAQNTLGALYQNGRGVKGDLDQAARLYQASAAKGNRHAMSNLAVLYAGADERIKNLSDAALWFQRSAMLGYVDAQFNLAVLYERGDGVPQSALDAYKWYTIAAGAGDAVAKTRADALETQLSADELDAARKAIAEYKPLPVDVAANEVPKMEEVVR